MADSRIEDDGYGPIQIVADSLWGPQTQRSLRHFQISNELMPMEFIKALACVKRACILANEHLGLMREGKAAALVIAAEEVMQGLHDKEFPLLIWQTGSGTQTNMNMNEVLANRGVELLSGNIGNYRLIHPNDDVNLGQSSNDVIPTAIHVALVCQLNERLLPSLNQLIAAIDQKSALFEQVIKVGRTHLQDAVPMTLGAEFSGYSAQLRLARNAIEQTLPALQELAIGGTAVGTGVNTHPEFAMQVSTELSKWTKYSFEPANNKYAAIAGHEAIVIMHGALKTLATALMKVSNDIRWLASGPRAGLGEINIPANEPGSSIMPGKVNPTQCEAVAMLCCQVLGNDVTISIGGSLGSFELNTYKPLILHNCLQSIRLLSDGMNSFREFCIEGISANESRMKELLDRSLMVATALAPHIGYENAAQIAKLAHQENISVREAAIQTKLVTGEQFDQWVNVKQMVFGK